MCGWAERRLKNEYGDYCGTSAWNRVRNTLANLQLGARAKLVKMTGLDRGRDGIQIRFALPAFKVPVTNSKPSILAARTRIELHKPWVAEALELGMSMLEMARAASEHSGLKVSNITVSRYFQDEGLDKPKKTPARVYREKVDARVRRYFEKHGTLDRSEMMEELALDELFLPWKTFCESYNRLLSTFASLDSSSSSDSSASEDGHGTPDTSLELDAPVIGPKPVVSE